MTVKQSNPSKTYNNQTKTQSDNINFGKQKSKNKKQLETSSIGEKVVPFISVFGSHCASSSTPTTNQLLQTFISIATGIIDDFFVAFICNEMLRILGISMLFVMSNFKLFPYFARYEKSFEYLHSYFVGNNSNFEDWLSEFVFIIYIYFFLF